MHLVWTLLKNNYCNVKISGHTVLILGPIVCKPVRRDPQMPKIQKSPHPNKKTKALRLHEHCYFARSPENLCEYFFRICLGICIKGQGFLVHFFWSLFPGKRSTKTPRKFRGNSEQNSGQNSGRNFEKFGELSFCTFSDLKHWESAKVSHKGVFALLMPEYPQLEMAQILQKPVFALLGSQQMSVNTLLCDTLGLDEAFFFFKKFAQTFEIAEKGKTLFR